LAWNNKNQETLYVNVFGTILRNSSTVMEQFMTAKGTIDQEEHVKFFGTKLKKFWNNS
jgi:hypothetical protein